MDAPINTYPYIINEEQANSFNEKGFLVVKNLLTEEEKVNLVKWTNEIRDMPPTKGKWMQYYEINASTNEKQLCRTENFTPFHDGIRSIVKGDKLMGTLSQLIGQPVLLFKEKINYKQAGGGGFPPHQDAPAYVQLGQVHHITAMLAVDASTVANGCLFVVPGSQKAGMLPMETDNTISREWCSDKEWIPVECEVGDVLIFGSYIAHKSGTNTTASSRNAIYLTYNAECDGDKHALYYDEKRRLFPPSSDREEGKDYSEGAKIYNLGTPINNNQ
ncbi:hypothetical protein SAMD00019534_039350 [Acytostelium subglobosum LB1]|uniref:hypothetical protein n=1 Tax=Acytostelium subglobosum LB1 TaxID=1410327 RepID=UPI0006449FEA|nr:hypothetical protein SAMD00019534_039350 [Acytostelium subglobosum LB1]GAM20760.1 hypothetical protein SAMD00019534_039350 [Acytostelium subglobosum LB1]|eukprot:XP_012755894.1 hypothetical protein SAMD00019534_039350 [Acytostelium subglobosum LB1]